MKYFKNSIIIILALVIAPIFLNAQELNENAIKIKTKYSNEYNSNFKSVALKKWKEDFSMVVFEINKQSDSFTELMYSFEYDETPILLKAIEKWEYEGSSYENQKIINEIKKVHKPGFQDYIKLKCDWQMVQYEYDKQINSKKSF